MSTISRQTEWSTGDTLTASDLNAEFDNIVNDYNGSISNANIAADAAIATTKISGTAVTLTGTEALTNKTISDTLTMTTGDITQSGTAAHITLTPGTSKLVRTAVLRQDNITDSYEADSVILTGWGFIQGDGSSRSLNETVTFGITFTAAPIIIGGLVGFKSNSDPSSISDTTGIASGNTNANIERSTTTGFTASITRTSNDGADPGALTSVVRYMYSWIAIGQFS